MPDTSLFGPGPWEGYPRLMIEYAKTRDENTRCARVGLRLGLPSSTPAAKCGMGNFRRQRRLQNRMASGIGSLATGRMSSSYSR